MFSPIIKKKKPVLAGKHQKIYSSEFWCLSFFCPSMIKWPKRNQKEKYIQPKDAMYVTKLIIKAY